MTNDKEYRDSLKALIMAINMKKDYMRLKYGTERAEKMWSK